MTERTPDRPETVPADATFSESDNEWVLVAKDGDGRAHGEATYWRPDGTLVNRCMMAHGTPHGGYKRYHENGEVSREGTFVNGRLHGTDSYYRTDEQTTESFPSGLGRQVWRAEMDMAHGRVVSARAFLRDGRPCTETGEPYPARPEAVPEAAVYSAEGGRWLVGTTDENVARDGLWQFYNAEGGLVQEIEYEHGSERWNRWYSHPEEALAAIALREGRPGDAAAAARRLYDRADSDPDVAVAGALLLRCLGDDPAADAVARAVAERVAPAQTVHWGVFTPSGKKALLALGEVLERHACARAEAGDLVGALAAIDRAIAADHHYGTARLRATKYRVLRALGRDDTAFAVARATLADNPDAAGFERLADDPEFAAWRQSISAASMTVEGAWQTLGEGGARLLSLVAPMLRETPRTEPLGGIDAFWDVAAELGDAVSPELSRYTRDAIGMRIEDTYRGAFCMPSTSTVSSAIAAEDGTWGARFQSLFLPLSILLDEDEELWTTHWCPTTRGTSTVYYTHQDEPGFWEHSRSIAGFLVGRMLNDSGFSELDLPTAVRERLQKALTLSNQLPAPEHPPHLDIETMASRTEWLVDVFLPFQLGPGFPNAPTASVWQEEQQRARAWPHLQVYWLLHHTVLGNTDALAPLIAVAIRSHPAVAELVSVAEALLAGEPVQADFWDDNAIAGIRARAYDQRGADMFTAGGLAAVEQALGARLAAEQAMASARAELMRLDDAGVTQLFGLWEVLESAAENVEGFEQGILGQVFEDMDAQMDYMMRQRNGHVSILMRVMGQFSSLVDARFEPFFRAVVARGAGFEEEHPSVIPGGLVGLGLSVPDFAAFIKSVHEQPFYDLHFGRRRRMEVAMVAGERPGQPAAQAFLVAEAERYVEQFSSWGVDTSYAALLYLIRNKHPQGHRVFNDLMAQARFSGANWKQALHIVEDVVRHEITAAAPGVLSAIRSGLGRHDDGDRAKLFAHYAALAGAGAVAVLSPMLDEIEDVRAECERAAILAGLMVAAPDAWADQARACIDTLVQGTMRSMQFGAAASLLRAIHGTGTPGFDEMAAVVKQRGERDKYAKTGLLDWMESGS